jgi:hypothetical protein
MGHLMDAETDKTPEAETEYAIVEVFGHRRHAGRVVEVEKFGTKLLRIDIPKDGNFEIGFTTLMYGGPSIFSYTPCDLATVLKLNEKRSEPARLSYAGPEDDDDLPF